MIRVQPLVAAVLLLIAARVVARTGDCHMARRRGAIGVGCALAALSIGNLLLHQLASPNALAALGTRLEFVSRGWLSTAPFVDLLVALLAVSLAPIVSHRPRTLAAMLDTIAIALAFLAFTSPLALAALWCGSIAVVAAELRRLDRATGADQPLAGVLVRYQWSSVGAAAVGTIALEMGYTTVGATAWLLAIAVREAVVPVHGWLPRLIARAPLGLVVALVAPQLGVYAQLAVVGEITGGNLAQGFAVVGAFTAIAGAAIGLAQSDARRAAGWLIISQTGLVALGLENTSAISRAGAQLAWQVMALAMSGFVMTLAALEARRGTLSLRRPGGSFARTPRMAVAFLLLGFSSVALPLTLGFVAEDLLVQGLVGEHPQIGFVVIVSTALNGFNVMRCFFALFSGTSEHIGEHDLTRLEVGALTLVMAVLLVGGLVPRLFVDTPSRPAMTHSSR